LPICNRPSDFFFMLRPTTTTAITITTTTTTTTSIKVMFVSFGGEIKLAVSLKACMHGPTLGPFSHNCSINPHRVTLTNVQMHESKLLQMNLQKIIDRLISLNYWICRY